MTMDGEEGANFLSAFRSKFAVSERTEKRRKADAARRTRKGLRLVRTDEDEGDE